MLCADTALGQATRNRVIEGFGEEGVIPVRILSSNADLQSLARRAFSLHGGYEVTAAGESFVFRFEPAAANSVRATISSGGRELEAQTISGSDPEDALLRAGDYAVRRTSGEPGFFAGKLAFVSQRTGHRELYVATPLFTGIQQLTREQSNCILPAWAPNGTKLLYTGYHESGFPDIFEIDLATRRRAVFAAYKGTNTGATYSPDGRQVAMILSNQGNAELYVTPANRTSQPRRLTNNGAVESGPSFSPDGEWIAVTSDRLGGPQIFKIPTRGGALQLVRTQLSGYCAEPDWNPREPGKLIFTAAVRGSYQLAMHDATTGKSIFLTSGNAEAAEPVWLNDGRHVVYTRRLPGERGELYLFDTVSGKTVRLSPEGFGGAAQADFDYAP
ncbi:MAG: biopolymer transporter Tol [Opitutales bacterium]